MVTAKLNYPKTLRFSGKTQIHNAKKLAGKSNRSLNSYILALIDSDIELNQEWLQKQKGKGKRTPINVDTL